MFRNVLMNYRCTVTVTAQNAISSVTSRALEVHVVAPIQRLMMIVLPEKERLVNRTLKFNYFAYRGTDMNMTWTFGDGSQPVKSYKKEELQHRYTKFVLVI